MGGEKEMTVEKPNKGKAEKTDVGNFRIHQNNGEVHIHDDANKLKVAMPVSAWWKIWDSLRNEPGEKTWIDSVNKTKLVFETVVDGDVVDVKITVESVTVSADWEKVNTFTKKK